MSHRLSIFYCDRMGNTEESHELSIGGIVDMA